MRQTMWFGIVLCGVAMQPAFAQQGMGVQQMSISQNQSIMASILEPVGGAPYQGEKMSRSLQTLSDGTVITHETRGMIARDAQGRIREELYQVHSGNLNGRQLDRQFQSATVGDPVAHTILIWTDEKTKIAMQMQLPSLPKGTMAAKLAAPPPPPPPPAAAMLKEDAAPSPQSSGTAGVLTGGIAGSPLSTRKIGAAGPKDDVRTEQLGQQSMEGVLVTGTRVTTTIPTGKVGNDRPIVVVHEEWRSPELKILVKTIDTDPRTGVQTMEVNGLVRTDPDEALFQAPPGYKIQDMAQMLKVFGDLGKPKTP
jgi:hypothetical protein